MSWIATGVTAGVGLLSAKQAQKQQKAQNMAAAAQTEYSPWTKMGAGQLQTGAPDPLMGAVQGGLGGYMMGKNFAKGQEDKIVDEEIRKGIV
jgi:hypothetical protein